MRAPVAAALLCCLAVWPAAFGHQFSFTEVEARFDEPGTFRIDMTVDVDALALGVSAATDSAEVEAALNALDAAAFEAAVERARSTLERRLRVFFDGERTPYEVEFPHRSAAAEPEAYPTVLGTTARLIGEIPPGAQEFRFRASRAFPAVQFAVVDEYGRRLEPVPVAAGAESPPFRLGTATPPPSSFEVARRYLRLGFEHILPLGVDHILFVLGLFLLGRRLRPLLWQVSAFTVAHTVTLGLSIYGVVSLPSSIVEPLIALSIAYVAVENLFTTELKPWRPALVFGFGLLHGLGFAGVLHELGLPEGRLLLALVGFNVGVELGQLAVILLAFLAVGWFRQRRWYRPAVVVPASLVIAMTGLYWAVQRVAG